MTTDSRLEALKSALASALPARRVTRAWCDSNLRTHSELSAGIYTLIARRESEYADYPGREAQLGTLELALIGQIQLAEKASGLDVERAELAMLDEIKAFVGNLPAGLGNLALREAQQSGQIEAPYGWVAFRLDWYLN
ncbi:hypothetical protein [Chitinimonas sp.]|uniref:hypothetical protein n=1 Tax=Chitinimonas sp. TaxID=1934313 RepID=UPI0035ADC917